jgi:hypothetical protein
MSTTTDPDIVEKVATTYQATVGLAGGLMDHVNLYQVGDVLIPSEPPWMSLMEWLRSGEVEYIRIEEVR